MSLRDLFGTRSSSGRHAAPDPKAAERDRRLRDRGSMILDDEYGDLFYPEPHPARHAAQVFAAGDRTDRLPVIMFPPTRGFRHHSDCLYPRERHSVCRRPGDDVPPGAWREATEAELAPLADDIPASTRVGSPFTPERAVVLHHEHRYPARPAPVPARPEEPAAERLACTGEVMSAEMNAQVQSHLRAQDALTETVLSDFEEWCHAERQATGTILALSWDEFLAAGTTPALTGGGQ